MSDNACVYHGRLWIYDPDDPRLGEVVKKKSIRSIKNWVQKLRVEEEHFEREIAVLKER